MWVRQYNGLNFILADGAEGSLWTSPSSFLICLIKLNFLLSEHENLPLESDYSEILGDLEAKMCLKLLLMMGAKPSGKDEENVMISGINVSEAFSEVSYLDDKMSKISVHGKQFAEGTTLEDFGLISK